MSNYNVYTLTKEVIEMEKLNVRFSDKLKSDLSALSVETGEKESVIARAAMQIGLEFLDRFDESQQSSFFRDINEFIEFKNSESK